CPIIGISGRNSAPSLVSELRIVPHHWLSVGGIVPHLWCQWGESCPIIGISGRN
ncbi:unnamed protein product, partial [Staurois parvus]